MVEGKKTFLLLALGFYIIPTTETYTSTSSTHGLCKQRNGPQAACTIAHSPLPNKTLNLYEITNF